MGLFKRRRGGAKAAGSVKVTPQLVEVLRLFDGTIGSFGAVYRKLAPVRTVVDFLAEAVATTGLKVYERTEGGRPEVPTHPVAQLLRRPNPEVTTKTLIGGTVRDLGTYGVAYWWKAERLGTRYLVPLEPERMTPGGADLLAPAYWDYARGGAPLRIPRSDVVYFRLHNPEDRRIGASKLEALRTILAEEVAASANREFFWKNAARREGIITQDKDAVAMEEGPELERFREQWRGKTAGAEKAGRTALLLPGMGWIDSAFSPRDAEFVEGRRFILEATCWAFNLPVALLGVVPTATFASQREFHKMLFQDTLPPWYETIQSEIELQLFPWFGLNPATTDLYVEFNVEGKMRGDWEAQVTALNLAIGRPYMTAKEGRDRMNLPDRGDPTDDWMAVPVNNVILQDPEGEVAPVAAPAALPGPTPALPAQGSSGRVATLKAALERQQRSVLSRVGAGGEFDSERWNRELADLVARFREEEEAQP